MAVWVCPNCPKKSAEKEIEKIQGLNRLYAFPREPKFVNGGLVILDSGAFGLSQSGGKMNFKYMQRLSEHYEKYYRENVLCVAPDEAINPEQTMMNFKKWHKNNLFPYITPVLHSDLKYSFSEDAMLFQADFYKKYTDVIFFGSPKLSARQGQILNVNKLFGKIKSLGYKWIHKLGVGWDLNEIKIWGNMENLDSFDSIAYYTAKDKNVFGSLDPAENVRNILRCLDEKNK